MKKSAKFKTTYRQMSRCVSVLWAGLVVCAALPVRADFYSEYGLSKTYQKCSETALRDKNWFDSVQCIDREDERLRKRIKVAQVNRLKQARDETQRKWMEDSQKYWIKHDDAECQSLRSHDTGDSRDEIAMCSMLKAARRLRELEKDDR